MLNNADFMQLTICKRLSNRRATVIRNAIAEIPPVTKNKPENGPGPKVGSLAISFEEEQLEENMSFPNRFISPLSVALRIASETSMTKGEPFGNT